MKLWIAREKSGLIFLYETKPQKGEGGFVEGMTKDGIPQRLVGSLTNDMFPEVTFENSPQQVEIKLKEE